MLRQKDLEESLPHTTVSKNTSKERWAAGKAALVSSSLGATAVQLVLLGKISVSWGISNSGKNIYTWIYADKGIGRRETRQLLGPQKQGKEAGRHEHPWKWFLKAQVVSKLGHEMLLAGLPILHRHIPTPDDRRQTALPTLKRLQNK